MVTKQRNDVWIDKGPQQARRSNIFKGPRRSASVTHNYSSGSLRPMSKREWAF